MPIFKSHLYQLGAYKPPLEGRDPEKHLLLDFNERTLPVSDPVRQALVDYINSGKLQMYPTYSDIVDRIAAYAGVEKHQVMITNGSDQGIELVFRASCNPGDEVIIPAPNFAFYHQCAKIENVRIIEPYYTIERGLPVDEIIAAVTANTRVICIANPNNPSGVGVSREDIVEIAKAAPDTSILVDECYYEYSKVSVVDLIQQFPNIVVTRTFSKTWGIPSLRFGYLIAAKDNAQALTSVRGPYDINQLAVVAAKTALDNPEYTDNYVREVMEEAKPQVESFLTQCGILFWPSAGNYLWVFPEEPEKVADTLEQNGILVRPKMDVNGRLGLRITIGSKMQCEKLMSVLESVV